MSHNLDFHTHTSLKTMLGGISNQTRKNCWTRVKSGVIDIFSGGSIGSQSCLRQMREGNVKIAVTALYSLEYAFANSWVLHFLAELEKDLSKEYLKAIRDYKVSPYENLKEELLHIKSAEKENENDAEPQVKIVNAYDEIDLNKMNIILATEGLHCFQNSYKTDDPAAAINDIKKNLKDFIEDNRVLYTGLAHLTRNIVCTHTYAMKMIKSKEFIPAGEGLTKDAEDIIDICYSGVGYNNKPTFIDIKHMGIVSRMQFYKYREEKGYTNIPIIASHMAVTGRSYKDIRIKNPGFTTEFDNTYVVTHERSFSEISYNISGSPKADIDFNPWSLNLYDEEIVYIIDSGGMMGLILDVRVLGAHYSTKEKAGEGIEYFSKECYDFLKEDNFKETPVDDNIEDIIIDIGHMTKIGFAHLFANLMHIVKTYYDKYADTPDKRLNAWDHICIGSDSDGLISTIGAYLDASYFDNLRFELSLILETAKDSELEKYFGDYTVEEIVEKIFWNNGKEFLKKYL